MAQEKSLSKGKRIRRAIPYGLVVFCILAVIVRLWIRDARAGLELFYYVTPWPVLAGLLLIAAMIWLARKRRRLAGVAFFGCVLALIGVGLCDYRFAGVSETESDVSVFFWNVARGIGGWDDIAETIRKSDADIIGLVEVTGPNSDDLAFWQEKFPEYDISLNRYSSLLMVRGKILDKHYGYLVAWSKWRAFDVEFQGRRMTVVLVDIDGNPLYSRGAPLEALAKLLRSLPDSPALVMGDFNTPVDSVFFEKLRPDYTYAFDAAGRGYEPTWPMPLPVMTLDQLWYNPKILRPCSVRRGWCFRSDHRPIYGLFAETTSPDTAKVQPAGAKEGPCK